MYLHLIQSLRLEILIFKTQKLVKWVYDTAWLPIWKTESHLENQSLIQ